MITNTHLKRHGMSKVDYLRAYPDAFLGACEWFASWRNSEENRRMLRENAQKVISDPALVMKRNLNRAESDTPEYRRKLSEAMKAYAQTEEGRQRFKNKPVTARMRMSNYQRWVEQHGVEVATQKQLEWQAKNVLPSKSRFTKIELLVMHALRDSGYNVVTQLSVPHYYCDIYVPELNLIVEVNGNYWHANPKYFASNDVIGHKRMTASQVWERDAKKVEDLRRLGYNVVTVWESDIKSMTSSQLVEDIVRHCEKSQ